MGDIVPVKIQIITIIVSLAFTLYASKLIIKGKLREEYAIFWIIMLSFLIFFAIWREGLTVIATLFGVYEAPNLIFTVAIFAIFGYLLHLSVTISKLYKSNKSMNQEIALLQNRLNDLEKK